MPTAKRKRAVAKRRSPRTATSASAATTRAESRTKIGGRASSTTTSTNGRRGRKTTAAATATETARATADAAAAAAARRAKTRLPSYLRDAADNGSDALDTPIGDAFAWGDVASGGAGGDAATHVPSSSRPFVIRGGRQHNLKNVNVDIPREKLVVFTGVSGSGKSSLVYDTLYAESRRQLLETLSSFARARLPKVSRPDADEINNLASSVVIDQRRMGNNPRSTVGTVTELFTLARLLFSRIGRPAIEGGSHMFSFNNPDGACSQCTGLGRAMTVNVDKLLDESKTLREGAVLHPDYKVGNWFWKHIVMSGLWPDKKKVSEFSKEERDLLLFSPKGKFKRRYKTSTSVDLGDVSWEGIVTSIRRRHINKEGSAAAESSSRGKFLTFAECPGCNGDRVCEAVRNCKIAGRSIVDWSKMELSDLRAVLDEIDEAALDAIDGDGGSAGAGAGAGSGDSDPSDAQQTMTTLVAAPVLKRMKDKLDTLCHIGVGYLSMSRETSTLSGGESQRVKMAKELTTEIISQAYFLDEPTVGLHERDVDRLLDILRRLVRRGNSVLVVEHAPRVILAADHVVEVGPGAGVAGGHIVFEGSVDGLKKADTLTARFLRHRKSMHVGYEAEAEELAGDSGVSVAAMAGYKPVSVRPRRGKPADCVLHGAMCEDDWYIVRDASVNNLKNITVYIPRMRFVAITGVAGSGKSSLSEAFIQQTDGVVVIDQASIGRSRRSNPATYTGAMDHIRSAFAAATGKPASWFSFNSKGACATCHGLGAVEMEMAFLEAVWTECNECEGRRFKDEVLECRLRGKNIVEVLRLTIDEAVKFFKPDPKVTRRLAPLAAVGLGYLTLGQSLSTLSGGETQRTKLASELGKAGSVILCDEPTTGLAMADVDRLVGVLQSLVDHGNTVIVIEHNFDLVRHADWIIDMGPGGGAQGGRVVAEGVPEEVIKSKVSVSAPYLKPLISSMVATVAPPPVPRRLLAENAEAAPRRGAGASRGRGRALRRGARGGGGAGAGAGRGSGRGRAKRRRVQESWSDEESGDEAGANEEEEAKLGDASGWATSSGGSDGSDDSDAWAASDSD